MSLQPELPPSRASRGGAVVVVTAAVAFFAGSLLPWRHLIGGGYALRFCAFTAALAVVALVVQAWLRRPLRGHAVWAGLLASVLVYVPVWWWNRREINVILLHLDSLRAADCSMNGCSRATTPRIEAFAREHGVLFRQFFSQSAGTDKSTPAELAGIYPSMFYDPWKDDGNYLVPDWFPLLGQYLAEDGYTSLAFSSNPQISLRRNYGRGFDQFEEVWKGQPRPAELTDLLERRIEAIGEPFFYFGLYIDPHLPYTPRPEFDLFSQPGSLSPPEAYSEVVRRLTAGEKPQDLPKELVQTMHDDYDGEIREVDDAVGALIDWLESSGRLDHTMLIVTADHGEKFAEHDEMGHGGTLYEEVIHVPLVWSFPSPLRFPALRPSQREFSALCCHVDLVPTILGYLGIDPPPSERPLQGRDLTPWLYGGGEPPEQDVLSEELVGNMAVRCLRSKNRKVIVRDSKKGLHTEELYDVSDGTDVLIPTAERDRLHAMVAEITRRVAALQRFYQDKPDELPPDAAGLQELHRLGYTK